MTLNGVRPLFYAVSAKSVEFEDQLRRGAWS